jgi:hypothetical protein
VGGNGGNAAAAAIQVECEAQGVTCSIIGVPKSIDNDILLVRRAAAAAPLPGAAQLGRRVPHQRRMPDALPVTPLARQQAALVYER